MLSLLEVNTRLNKQTSDVQMPIIYSVNTVNIVAEWVDAIRTLSYFINTSYLHQTIKAVHSQQQIPSNYFKQYYRVIILSYMITTQQKNTKKVKS